MPVTLNDDEVREIRALLHDLVRNPFSGGEINAMGGLRSVLSRSLLQKLCVQVPENKTAEALYGIELTQPVGNCCGDKLHAYDSSREDGKGERLVKKCPGCRACS